VVPVEPLEMTDKQNNHFSEKKRRSSESRWMNNFQDHNA
jgi:hypothetical protein